MLASITPLGERGRGGRWGRTVSAFSVGSVGAGALVGAVMGLIGLVLLGPPAAGDPIRLVVLALALAAGLVLELVRGTAPLPGPRRQVNEDWLHSLRPWVYGAAFGAQLGAGVATVVNSAAVPLMLLAAGLTGSPALGAVIGACHGAGRALALLPGARVRTTGALMALHHRLEVWRARSRLAVLGVEATLVVVALVLAES